MEDCIFQVPDINLYPRFSVGRHKPQSRLHNFHTLDYDEEMFIDISYCDRNFSKTLNSNCLNVSLNDFNSLLSSRKGSTSTPFRTVSNRSPVKQAEVNLRSLCEDSGFNESSVANTFALSCKISSPVIRKPKRPRESESHLFEDDFPSKPLPCVALEKQFERLVSDGELSNDGIHMILESNEFDCTQVFNEIEPNEPIKPIAFEKNISDASSGYGSLCSQLSSNSILKEYASVEQIVPEWNASSPTDGCENSVTVSQLPDEKSTHSQAIPVNDVKTRRPSFQECMRDILSKVAPSDIGRVIGKKIGLDHVDIVGELRKRTLLPALKKIFQLVDAKDLCSMALVSRDWKLALSDDKQSDLRRKAFIRSEKVPLSNKENDGKTETVCRNVTKSTKGGPLGEIQKSTTVAHQVLPKEADVNYKRFIEVAANLKSGDELRKCPKCTGPAPVEKVQERAICVSATCAYDFCIKCRACFHGSADCVAGVSKKSRNDVKVASKKSKQALRRL